MEQYGQTNESSKHIIADMIPRFTTIVKCVNIILNRCERNES